MMKSFTTTTTSSMFAIGLLGLIITGSIPSFVFGQTALQIIDRSTPTQTLFIPLPEQSVRDTVLIPVTNDANNTKGVVTMIAVAISTDNTVIWYDHWEDGFEPNVTATKLQNPSTTIWGDRNASNGCAPKVNPCTDTTDVLRAGSTIQIQNTVAIPRNKAVIFYDGGDMIQASYPITVTRASYAADPGSVLAGAVEVLESELWGTEFESPVGDGQDSYWQISRMFIMAGVDQTWVQFPNSSKVMINKGQSISLDVKIGDKVNTSDPVQVDILTGDRGSHYEMRWYSLISTDQWTTDYLSPVGDTTGKTTITMYNPSPTTPISVNVTYWNGAVLTSSTVNCNPKATALTKFIPSGSGARLIGTGPFIPFSYTDTLTGTGGQTYDWGFPLMPTETLTPQVVIGLGYGCTNNTCGVGNKETARSPVWISPVDDAYIFIDYNNTGNNASYEIRKLKKYQSTLIRNPYTKDMSGALIFARAWNQSNSTEVPSVDLREVDIASAWGQDPQVSGPLQPISLDLGTVVVPFKTLHAWKTASINHIIPGEIFTYKISIMNVGQSNVRAGKFRITDILDPALVYVENTTMYSPNLGITKYPVPDSTVGTPFPLDGTGLPSMFDLMRRGDIHEVYFNCYVDGDKISNFTVVNRGQINPQRVKFRVDLPLNISANISVSNTVYLGQDAVPGAQCNTSAAKEVATANSIPANFTYCFLVTNNGDSPLLETTLTNPDFNFTFVIGRLNVSDSVLVPLPMTMFTNLTNTVFVSGKPAFKNGTPIGNMKPVIAQDPSTVVLIKSETLAPTKKPSSAPSTSPSNEPTASPSEPPVASPSASPVSVPSAEPSASPSSAPYSTPSSKPSTSPSTSPLSVPSTTPSATPIAAPSSTPSALPIAAPSASPSDSPITAPSASPSDSPITAPSASPSDSPFATPSASPSASPTIEPSASPSDSPITAPSASPSDSPFATPSASPSASPTIEPSASPSTSPVSEPSASPSESPFAAPSHTPSSTPISAPSSDPSTSPSGVPSTSPSTSPFAVPSSTPSAAPSVAPSSSPSATPTTAPNTSPSVSPSAEPSASPSATPSVSPVDAPSSSPSASPSSGPSLIPSASPSGNPSSNPSASPSAHPSASPLGVPSADPSASPSVLPSASPSASPTVSPSASPSNKPSIAHSGVPTITLSAVPTSPPTFRDSVVPTSSPSSSPSATPSSIPSSSPSASPSAQPSVLPSATPSVSPSTTPSSSPSATPSNAPSSFPTALPSVMPSISPSAAPSALPSSNPTVSPSSMPSTTPTVSPSLLPSTSPSGKPSTVPSASPSTTPTSSPSALPSSSPSSSPTGIPSMMPSPVPSNGPSAEPSTMPTISPSATPSAIPSATPTTEPSSTPSDSPTGSPSSAPSSAPSSVPSTSPSSFPSGSPSGIPSTSPSSGPSGTPSAEPSSGPSGLPSAEPSSAPSAKPSANPSSGPSAMPSANPSSGPSAMPSAKPSSGPSAIPSAKPSSGPSASPTATPSSSPSQSPSFTPSTSPSSVPSTTPTTPPSTVPSTVPSFIPTFRSLAPSSDPTSPKEISEPTSIPSIEPSIAPTRTGEPRSEDKCNMFDPSMYCNKSCMEDVYNEGTKTNSTLICRANEVKLSSIRTDRTGTCKLGTKITLDLYATIEMVSSRYDLGWYIATDGGDALNGVCAVNSLDDTIDFNVTGGNITWKSDAKFRNDVCGDVFAPTASSPIKINSASLAKQVEIICEDINGDGYLDFSLCFSWRKNDTDTVCGPSALYPASTKACDCATYDVYNITTTTNSTCI